jgi:RNA polymerase sigma factor (sigma-70 family)
MKDDATLLLGYAHQRSEADFAELVRRHLDFVYSVALRELNGDAHLAQDATQLVFTDLARKAGQLAGHRLLAGWLFNSTRYTAANLVRGARRRQAREAAAQLMQSINAPEPAGDLEWERVRPVLDEALGELNDRDREAVLLRFLQNRDYAAIGARLALSDNAARMCVDRALDKLRAVLARRGVSSASAALAAVLTTQAVVAAPAGLATSVTGTALATGGVAVAATTFMSLTKLQLGFASALAVAGGGLVLHENQVTARLRAEIAALPSAAPVAETDRQRAANQELARTAAEAETARVEEIEWDRLRDEAAALQARQAENARQAREQEARARAKRASEAKALSELDVLPKPGRRVAPAYPFALRDKNVAGSVVVEMVIDNTGKVAEVKVVKSSHPEFEMPALQAIQKWEFTAGRANGRAVNTRVTQLLQFQPSGEPAPVPPPDWF